MKKILSVLLFLLAPNAYADDEGIARPWQLNFQTPATPVMEKLYHAHTLLLWLISGISLFVLVLLIVICLRFNRRVNPVPSKNAHNTRLEILWTAIPILILVAIAIPSLRIHYYMQHVVEPEMTLKVVGYQWYWHYDYPDNGGFGFDSYIKKDHLGPNEHRLLAVDNHLVVPVDTKIRVLITGADVIHSWAVPAFGVKRDAIPGRLNETWFRAEKTGTYYGQCSELCGVGHGFMPIVIDVVSKDDFASWVKKQGGGAANGTNAANAAKGEVDKATAPLAKPEPQTNANPEPKTSEEKKRSESKGEGKPSQPAPAPRHEQNDEDTNDTHQDNE